MAKFEKRIIERKVRVFQVEAENEDQAETILQGGMYSDYETESFSIDAEEPDGWLPV
jgi:GMP synthase PP-ATPase subunit